MKYLIALIFALIITIVIITYYSIKKEPQTLDYWAKIESIEKGIDSLNRQGWRIDTLIIRSETKIKTIENNYYHEKINIINLSNDSQFVLLRHNIARYTYLLDTARR
jgi:hypothetical protein